MPPDRTTAGASPRKCKLHAFVDVPFIPLGQILPPSVHRRSLSDMLTGYALFWNLRKA